MVDNLRPKPFILVCGYTGVGKTSLIQKICGSKVVSEGAIGHGEPTTNTFKYYENNNFRFIDTIGMTPSESSFDYKNRIIDFYRSECVGKPDEDCPFIIWYCIAGCNGCSRFFLQDDPD